MGEHSVLQVLIVKLVNQPSVICREKKKRQQKPHHVSPHALESPNFACEWALVLWVFMYLVFLVFLEGIYFNLVLRFVFFFPPN